MGSIINQYIAYSFFLVVLLVIVLTIIYLVRIHLVYKTRLRWINEDWKDKNKTTREWRTSRISHNKMVWNFKKWRCPEKGVEGNGYDK